MTMMKAAHQSSSFPLPGMLQSLHQSLELLVDILRQQQEFLRLPQSQDAENAERLYRLEQDKHQHFQVVEQFSDKHNEMLGALTHIDTAVQSTAERAQCLSLWREIDELAMQAARLDHLNGMLIRQRLNHNQLILRDLRDMRWSLTRVATAASS